MAPPPSINALLRDNSQVEQPKISEEEARFVVALIQNRAKEVGFAALDRNTSTLWLAQYVEATRSFTNTRTMLEVHSPDTLLTCISANFSSLPDTGLNAALHSYTQTPLPRSMFDDTEGLVLVQMCASESSSMDISNTRGNYLAFGAAGALLKYTQEHLGFVLSANTLSVIAAQTPYHTQIDAASIESLQLVQSSTTSKITSTHLASSKITTSTSLFKFLDATKTRAGAQLLRANLLQPLRDIPTLNARYDVLDELLSKENLLFSLDGCLKQLPKNMDTVCGNLVFRPTKSDSGTLRRIAAAIQSFIQLREIITTLGPLAEALQDAESSLLCALHSVCTATEFDELLPRLDGLLDDDVHSARSAFLNRTQQCFALRSGVNPLLDIARQSFCKVSETVYDHANEIRETHDLPALKVQYTARRGFYFSIPSPAPSDPNTQNNNNIHAKRRRQQQQTLTPSHYRTSNDSIVHVDAHLRLPSSLIFLQSQNSSIQCTTDILNALNTRLQDSSNDCLCLTEEILDEVSQEIIDTFLPLLHRLIDGIALVDMLCGFAHKIQVQQQQQQQGEDSSSSRSLVYTRPILTTMGTIALIKCRHAVVEATPQCAYFQPNDTYLSLDSSFHVIAGPNMSGKSTYLQQIALSVIMAQVGCFVPAHFVSLTPVDKIFTRMGMGDNIETNSSSFMQEMEETSYILKHATPRSLVLIDELGRSTSTLDGLGIAWAVSESLIERGVKTVIASHFSELNQLERMYPQCRTWNFKVDTYNDDAPLDGDGTSHEGMKFCWKLESGCAINKHYGLLLAKSVQFPMDVIEKAKEVIDMVEKEEKKWIGVHSSDDDADRIMSEDIAPETKGNIDVITLEEERRVWEMMGKVSCLAQAYLNGGFDQNNGEELIDQLKMLQDEAK